MKALFLIFKIALSLVVLPESLRILTVYAPSSETLVFSRIKDEAVAFGMASPLWNHW